MRLSAAKARALEALSPRYYRVAPKGVHLATLSPLLRAGLVGWTAGLRGRVRWRRTAAGSRALAAIGGAL